MPRRLWVAILTTPLLIFLIELVLTPALLLVGVFWTIGAPDHYSALRPRIEGLALTYLDALVLGIPALFVLRWCRANGWFSYCVAGFAVAVFAASIGEVAFAFADSGASFTWKGLSQIVHLPIEEPRGTQMFLAPAAVYGPLTALIFWLISRPDRVSAP